jgi:8-amino-7-oxononanoate synthase
MVVGSDPEFSPSSNIANNSNPAIIICTPLTRLYLINYARPLIYTTFMSHPSLLAIKLAYNLMQSGQTEPLVARLNDLITYLYIRLQNLQRSTLGLSPGILVVPSECPNSPIFALRTRQPQSLAKHCQNQGFAVRAVTPPVVPTGTERVRICLHARNEKGEIDQFVACVGEWVRMQTKKESEQRIGLVEIKEVEGEPGARAVLSKL